MYRHTFFGCVALLAGACTATPPTALINTKWIATEVAGQPVVEGARSWLEFSQDGRVTGHGGCNRYSGNAKFDDSSLRFDGVAATKMACANPAAMDQENRLFAAYDATRTYRMEGKNVLLLDDAGKAQVRFQPQ